MKKKKKTILIFFWIPTEKEHYIQCQQKLKHILGKKKLNKKHIRCRDKKNTLQSNSGITETKSQKHTSAKRFKYQVEMSFYGM